MPVSVSIIVIAYGPPGLTFKCFDSLQATVDMGRVEVIVFDNGSGEMEASELRRLADYDGVRLLRSARNLGYAGACNAAAREAEGDKLVFLNNDIVALAGWLEPLPAELDGPGVACAGPLLFYSDGTIQHAGLGLGLWGLPLHLNLGLTPRECNFSTRKQVLALTGACLAFKRDVFERLGGFDEDYFFSYEDVDICLRARSMGLSSALCQNGKLEHLESATSGSEETLEHRRAAESVLLAKWGGLFDRAVARGIRSLERRGVSRVAIFGSGKAGRILAINLARFSNIEIDCFLDSDIDQAGKAVMDRPILHPGDLPLHKVDAVLGASMFSGSLARQAREFGFAKKFTMAAIENIDDADFVRS